MSGVSDITIALPVISALCHCLQNMHKQCIPGSVSNKQTNKQTKAAHKGMVKFIPDVFSHSSSVKHQ